MTNICMILAILAFYTIYAPTSLSIAAEKNVQAKKSRSSKPNCKEIERGITKERRLALAPNVAKQLNVANVDILQLWQMNEWSILYADTHETDEVYLFYSKEPLVNRYIVTWSGAARIDEYEEIKKWTIKNAPNIPLKLAECFSLHVTKKTEK